jgi:hypothetical protein
MFNDGPIEFGAECRGSYLSRTKPLASNCLAQVSTAAASTEGSAREDSSLAEQASV